MKLYYKDKGYPLVWKTGMSKNCWYSMEPAKLKVTMPESIYNQINLELKDSKLCNDKFSIKRYSTFKFDVRKLETENVFWGLSSIDEGGFWGIECNIYSASVSSKFRDGTVTAIFDVSISGKKLYDKSKIRDIILSELV